MYRAKKFFSIVFALIMCVGIIPLQTSAADAGVSMTLKYKGGGSLSKWSAQEATISVPVCADIDGDGKKEIIYSARSIFCTDAATGVNKWLVKSGHDVTQPDASDYGRTSSPLEVLDFDGDGKLEIVTFQTNYSTGSTCIAVYDQNGRFEKGFPIYTEIAARAAHVSDLDGDGKYEICIGLGVGASKKPSLYVYNNDGELRAGWPKTCGYGFYSNTIASGDMDGDGIKEIVALFDEERVLAFHADGTPVTVDSGVYAGLEFSAVPVCEGYDYEMVLLDWAKNHGGISYATSDQLLGETRDWKNCMVGTYGGVAVDDLDGDGTKELAFSSMFVDGSLLMRNGGNTYEGVAQYFSAFILNCDRTRYKNDALGFDWTQIPTDPAQIISMSNKNLETPDCSPVVADLDGDGEKEILYTCHDGMIHCFGLNGKENGSWPYNFNSDSSKVVKFASKPTCADIDFDGEKEVVFATYTESNQLTERGCVYVLDCRGNLLAKATLPPMWGATEDKYRANGCQAAPCVADIDGDGMAEIVVTTQNCGTVAYELTLSPFRDVPNNDWYSAAVRYCYRNGFMTGTSGNTFSPNSSFTRAMFVTVLAKIDGADTSKVDVSKPSFKDVAADQWYAKPVEWALKNGYTSGTSAGNFSPNMPVTRETLAQFFYNYSKKKGADVSAAADLSKYTDSSAVSSWASDAVKWAVASGLISGTTPTTVSPKLTASRAQVALIVMNYIKKIK